MPYTGSPDTPIDEVRFLVGDINPERPLLSDGEVFYALEKKGQLSKPRQPWSPGRSPARCRFGSLAMSSPTTRIPNGAEMAKEYRALATSSRESSLSSWVVSVSWLYAGGISVTDKEAVEATRIGSRLSSPSA